MSALLRGGREGAVKQGKSTATRISWRDPAVKSRDKAQMDVVHQAGRERLGIVVLAWVLKHTR